MINGGHMRKLDILEVVKAGNAFKIQVVTPEGEVLMAGKKTYTNKANAKQAIKAFALRHNKFSFEVRVTDAHSPCLKGVVGTSYHIRNKGLDK